jgi:hypothetical protein
MGFFGKDIFFLWNRCMSVYLLGVDKATDKIVKFICDIKEHSLGSDVTRVPV